MGKGELVGVWILLTLVKLTGKVTGSQVASKLSKDMIRLVL